MHAIAASEGMLIGTRQIGMSQIERIQRTLVDSMLYGNV